MQTVVGWRGVGVRLDGDKALLAKVVSGLPDFFSRDVEAMATGTVVEHDGVVTLALPDDLGFMGPLDRETLRAAASRIELFVADQQPDVIVVHAGVVAFGERAIVLPGSSMAGKSTLSRALLACGATYMSDEYAVLGIDGRVSAYPRRMTIRTPSGSERVLADSARGVSDPPVPVGMVAALRYSTGGWDVAPMTPASTVLELVGNGVNVRRLPALAMRVLATTAETALGLRGSRGEADDAARRLRDELT